MNHFILGLECLSRHHVNLSFHFIPAAAKYALDVPSKMESWIYGIFIYQNSPVQLLCNWGWQLDVYIITVLSHLQLHKIPRSQNKLFVLSALSWSELTQPWQLLRRLYIPWETPPYQPYSPMPWSQPLHIPLAPMSFYLVEFHIWSGTCVIEWQKFSCRTYGRYSNYYKIKEWLLTKFYLNKCTRYL